MRENKYRVWYEKAQAWVYFEVGKPFTKESIEIYHDVCLQGNQWYQYTGLHDKNGKEIYEGDIVKVLEKGTWYTVEVAYALCGFFMKPLKANPFFARLHFTESENGSGIDNGTEIIGNIWETPDLLPLASEGKGE